ncbi:cation diffusion facilitator family transporter [Bartonella ancashensis]|uniref:Cobalt-zinc-cadmium resistance protein n=1 Tax=Bartonella ancashensis TaxID=1318743 RepID=A0A0M4L838_9HYPH|nr:cation diffusion facilitator family transporter [Bartonella ancashensis]ALE03563.1 Cobalt-zinc-cadmium resistance protein [Bartonella ancashensis]
MRTKIKIQKLTLWSILVACVVCGLKYIAYHITGSVALYSDALESIVNVIAAFVAWWAVKISMKPADQEHPFGHHKAEYFSAVFEGVLVILAAIIILREAWLSFKTVELLQEPGIWMVINIAASILNYCWSLVLIQQGKIHHSPALQADGAHLMTDVVTSFAILAGLVTAFVSGWTILDPILAIIVAVHILWQGWKVINNSIQGLMDAGVSLNEIMRIYDLILANACTALEVHDLRTRIAGRAIFIEFHLVVPAVMQVEQAHHVCNKIEKALEAEFENAHIVVHIEPESEAKFSSGSTVVPFI